MVEEFGLSIIADRYAEAILMLAEEKGCLDYVKNDLATVSSTIIESKEFKNFLEHPLIKVKDKKDLIETAFTGKISPLVLNLIKILLDRRRMNIFLAVKNSFTKLFNKKFNIISAEITSAIPLDQEIVDIIKGKLSQIVSKEVIISQKVDPAIIGGVIVRLEDNIIDGSVRGKLDKIQKLIV